ncbi:uncharacterized protein LOC21411485 isoform X2 [Morus notabilis]|uniref:uncharacterized protein LOC21411485 isoform X2 n=1 Tax=Morus notabilis TaxID=981085 RepID=UPI000CED5480|nr:uncharacterized protein LOC21411485 isoform X2 [Morus notabilis]
MFTKTIATGVFSWTPSSGVVPCEPDKNANDKEALPEDVGSNSESDEPIPSEGTQDPKKKRQIEPHERKNKKSKNRKGNLKVVRVAKLSEQIDRLIDVVETISTESSIAQTEAANCSIAKVIEVLDSLPELEIGSCSVVNRDA